MKKHVLFLLALVLGLSACNEKTKGFKVDVSLANGNDKTVYLQKFVDNTPVIIDSAVIKNDLATMTAPIDDPQILYALKVKGMRGSMPFFADNQDVTIVGDMHNPDAVAIMASETQTELDAYNDHLHELQVQVIEHYQAMNNAIEEGDSIMMDSLTNVGTSLLDNMNSYRDEYVKEHADSFLAHYILNESKQEYEIPYLKELMSNFTSESIYTKELNEYIAQKERLEVGQPFIDFTLNTKDDTELVLSQFVPQNKLTLVDFWASWCGPCRHENPVVKAAYEQFHELGFDVVGVSVDQDEAAWLQAVEEDQLPWTQVRDAENKVSTDYMIYYIPSNFLFDQEGTMVAKGLRGEDLAAKLTELLK